MKVRKRTKMTIAIIFVVLLLVTAVLIMDNNHGKTKLYQNNKSDVFISTESSSLCPWNTYVVTTANGEVLATGHSYLTSSKAVANPLEIHSSGEPVYITLSWAGTYELKPGESELLQWALSPNLLFVSVV